MAFPDLQIQANSGLSFPWAEFVSRRGSTWDGSFGQGSGQYLGMDMLIEYDDLERALPELIGFSWRENGEVAKSLHRNLPFRHPRFTQLWCTRIVSAKGVRAVAGKRDVGYGPVAKTTLILLTLQFTRPKYNILADQDVGFDGGYRAEWLRFTDRQWSPAIHMLSREGMQFKFNDGNTPNGMPPGPKGTLFKGSKGQKISKVKLTRRWHQLPEAAIYDGNGFPAGVVGVGTPFQGTVNTTVFLGCPPGTLLYEAPEIIQVELPMPPVLMNLGFGELFPLQYDIVFHFEYFNPPLGPNTTAGFGGHNTMPWQRDGLWYYVDSQQGNFPPFSYYEHRKLFRII